MIIDFIFIEGQAIANFIESTGIGYIKNDYMARTHTPTMKVRVQAPLQQVLMRCQYPQSKYSCSSN